MAIPSTQTLVQSVIEDFQCHPEKLGGVPMPFSRAITIEGVSMQWYSDDDLRGDLRKQGLDEMAINQILGIDLSDL